MPECSIRGWSAAARLRQEPEDDHFAAWLAAQRFRFLLPAEPGNEAHEAALSALWDILESNAFPADIAALLAPDGFTMAPIPAGMDHDEFAEACRAYLDRKAQAHRADSPAGPALSGCEIADLDERRAQIVGQK